MVLGLESGEEVADVTVGEPLVTTGEVPCWRGQRPDGSEATVHSIPPTASEAARDHFLSAATELAERLRAAPIRGVLKVMEVDPVAGAYVGDIAPLGTMVDVSLLKWTPDQQLEFMRHLCTCLQAMHDAGLIHGCLRPENVLLDGDLRPVVANAQAIDVAAQCRAHPERADDFRGHVAPEVRAGQTPTARADIYSAGRLLHFMLLGAEPQEFDEDIPRLDSLHAAPPGLVRIVRRCTTRDPAQRYESAKALLADIDRYVRDEPTGLKHPGIDDAVRFAEAAASAGQRPAVAARPAVSLRPSAPEKRESEPPPGGARRRRKSSLGFLKWTRRRAMAFGIAGLGVLAVAIGITLARGADHISLKVVAMLGGALLGLAVPGFGRSVRLSRVLIVVVVMALVAQVDPTELAAKQTGRPPGSLQAATLEGRTAEVLRLKAAGTTTLPRVDLAGANLNGADLRGLVLDGSTLRGATCQGADLSEASLLNVDVTQADFSGAKLTNTNPTYMVGWASAKCDSKTAMPPGWSCSDGHPLAAKREGG